MDPKEQTYYEIILERCRATGPGHWVMRKDNGQKMVVDLSQTEAKPGGYDWERREKHIAVGETWLQVFARLPKED